MTESGFLAMLRSALRRKSMHWKPIKDALLEARRPNQSDNPRLKWEYQCAHCTDWHPGKDVEVDHIKEAGSLLSTADLPAFVENLFCEADGLKVLCKKCHNRKTHNT